MTRATLCALLAGTCTAAAILELAAVARARGIPARRSVRRASRAIPILLRVGRRLGRPGTPRDLGARLAAAGSPLGLSPADVMAVKLAAALAGLLLALPLAAAAPGRLGFVLLSAGPAAAFLIPDLWLWRRTRRRARAIAAELADVLDLMRVAVDAGLPVARALGEVGRRHAGVLAAELATTATAIELGVPRDGALAALRERAPVEAVAALVAAIARTERHGAPLAPALVALAADARAEQGRALVEEAAKAAPKIQLAVALLLVPAAMLVVAAGAVAALVPH